MKKALVVGIDEYPVQPLDGCVNDANAIEKLLSSAECGFLVKKLINNDATRAAVKREIKWALNNAEFTVLYFAGHGFKTEVTTYLATVDSQDDDEGVDVGWIQQAITSIAAEEQTVVVLLDCCHSGASRMDPARHLSVMTPSDLPALRGRGRVLIAACNSEQEADESTSQEGITRGKFSFYLDEALQGYAANGDGIVTLSAIYDYISWHFESEKDQTPVFRGDHEGVVVLAKNLTPLGGWKQKSPDDSLTPEQAFTMAKHYLDRVLDSTRILSHEDWQKSGYRSACQTYEPIRKWFLRVIDQNNFAKNAEFLKLYKTFEQYGRQLGTLTTGTLLPQGKVGDSLGFGTFGTVFKVEDEHGIVRCLKLYHANDLGERAKLGRFRRGYDAMRQMDHPAIVKVREFSEVPFGFFMDYIPGPNARDYLPGINDDPPQIIKLLLQVAETLQHAHGKEVIHRDVKPENILIRISETGESSAFLTDFDLAWFSTATKVTKLAEGFGSHFYAAPEQMARPNSPAARSALVDVYSFGQLSFFFLTGRDPAPMDHANNVKVLSTTLGQHWTEPHAAKKLIKFYSDATENEPKRRPNSFRDICQLLAEVELALNTQADIHDVPFFLSCLRFTVAGDFCETDHSTAITMRSRSGVTEITAFIAKETQHDLGIDVSLRPDNLFVEGMKSQDARQVIIQRLDAALQIYHNQHGIRRTGGKGGAFEVSIRIEHLAKNISGVLKAREIISKAIDVMERS